MHQHSTAVAPATPADRAAYLDRVTTGPAFGEPVNRFPSDDELADYYTRHEPTLTTDEADVLEAIRGTADKRRSLQHGVAALLRKLNRSDLAAVLTATASVAVVAHVDGQRVAETTYRIDAGENSGEWTTDHRTDDRTVVTMAVDSFLLSGDLPDVPALGFQL
ncbi:MAG: hypothetical protein AAGD32_13615 [Planctomycetota bacterium]